MQKHSVRTFHNTFKNNERKRHLCYLLCKFLFCRQFFYLCSKVHFLHFKYLCYYVILPGKMNETKSRSFCCEQLCAIRSKTSCKGNYFLFFSQEELFSKTQWKVFHFQLLREANNGNVILDLLSYANISALKTFLIHI